MSVEDDITAERKAYRALKRHASAIAKDCSIISHIGDGNCGHILEVVFTALIDAGMYKTPQPSKPKKEKIGNSLKKLVFERDKYRCVFCGSHLDLEADHVYPESLGGKATFGNLQTLCKPCNMKKSNIVMGCANG